MKNSTKSIVSYCFSNSNIELKLKKYLSDNSNLEIFVVCLGVILGKKENEIVFEIRQLLPFPNLSSNPELTVIPPNNWEQILNETLKLEGLRFLGFIHSHINAISKRSRADTNYALLLSQTYGAILMGIIGKGLTLRIYHVTDNRFTLIKGQSQYFKIRTK